MAIDLMKKSRIPALLVTLAASSLALTGCISLPGLGGGGGDGDETTSSPQAGDQTNGGDQGGDQMQGGDDAFVTPESQDVFDITVGDCIANADDGNDPTATEVYSVSTVPCTQPHAYEVFHEFAIDDQPDYPGNDAVTTAAEQGCTGDGFTDYIGTKYLQSELYVYWYTPTPGSWAAGDRMVSCMVLEPAAENGGNPTSSSLKGSNR